MPLEKGHQCGQLVEDGLLLRRLQSLDDAAPRVRAKGSHEGVREGHQPLESLPCPEIRGIQQGGDAVAEVVGQPRNGAELHPVRLLVQRHPEPEVRRRELELTLDGADVGRHEQQARLGALGVVATVVDIAGADLGTEAAATGLLGGAIDLPLVW